MTLGKNLLRCGVPVLVFCCLFALPRAAQADTDYICLRDCVQQGGSSASCMASCTLPDRAQVTSPHQTHDTVATPLPLTGTTAKKTLPTAPQPEKDYACFSACLQETKAYAACERSCAKPACAGGEILCAAALHANGK